MFTLAAYQGRGAQPTPILLLLLAASLPCLSEHPDVATIVRKSVAVNDADFAAAPQFTFKERDREGNGTKTYQVLMIEGTPYNRLIEINGKPLKPAQVAEQKKKEEQTRNERRSESPEKRRDRIAAYEKERKRDHALMSQLTVAFNFSYLGERRVHNFHVYVLKATPKPSYNPPSMETQVLKGMQGELWVESSTFHWVRVTARVIHPVSIEGFLAQVEPGTQFEMQMSPADDGIWQMSHFSMKSHAKVLYMFNRSSEEDETYFDYHRISH